MDLQLQGRRALVTGGTAGIGLAIAQVLAEEGAHVAITGRSEEKLESARMAFRADLQPGIDCIVADAGTAEGCTTVVNAVPEADILVNNLGIYEPKPFDEIPDADWARLFEVNVMSGVRLSRAYLPAMRKRNWGRVIFIASESAFAIAAEMVHYSTTKAAQVAITRGIAESTQGTGVTANVILPGPTRSEGIIDFLRSMSADPSAPAAEIEAAFFANHRQSSLLQRLIDPREIASMVAYVASPLSSATNGAALRVEGGLLRQVG